MATKKAAPKKKAAAKKELTPEMKLQGFHLVIVKVRGKPEFTYYGYSNGNHLDKPTEVSYKRREGVYGVLLTLADLVNPGQKSIVIHDHTREAYRLIGVERRKGGFTSYVISDKQRAVTKRK